MEIVKEYHFNREMKVFNNRPQHLFQVLVNAAEKYPEKEALVSNEKRLTYKEFVTQSLAIAGNLQQYEVKKGDRIALLVDNSMEFALLVFAIAKIGAIFVPLNTKLKEKELKYMLAQSEAKVLVSDYEFQNVVDKLKSHEEVAVQYYFTIHPEGKQSGSDLSYEELTQPSKPTEIEVNEDDPAYIMYTSGTTGLPKGAMGSHLGLVHSAMNYEQVFKTSAETKTLITIPLFHVTGLIGQLFHMVQTGGTSVIMRKYKTPEYIKRVAEENITFLFNVPAIYIMMMEHEDFHSYTYQSVNCIAYGGAPLASETFYLLRRYFSNAYLHNAYGATETHSPTTLMPQIYTEDKVKSVGLPVTVADVKIIDENGDECPAGKVGELLIKGPMVIEGYWNNEEANRKSFVDGYWCSGDLATVDQDGFVYIMDRKKDMINRGGEKIFSIEVENVLYEHPGILEAAVVGIPDKIFGETVKAVVVPKGHQSLTSDDVIQFVAERLAKYKVPTVVEFMNELPRNPGGKILKNEIK
ncbi:AMP-binding protein [Mesobacillus maritimus]|nr:AMP-binding protein [Mesobacillus maritimus]MCM3584674.1 AMP-binding protein [Mesobacillus maritimus]